ncbi:MAG: molybdopterin-guanine dinucleotide biosynthesis protein B [Ostreibacterium sp.]
MLPQIDINALPFALLGFSADSGTGKTTLLKQLIPALKSQGLRLGLIKHSHHRIIFDNGGLTKNVFSKGVDVMAVSPTLSMAEWHFDDPKTALQAGIETYQHLPIDLLLIEGFKAMDFPKIELHRALLNNPLRCYKDSSIIALASDTPCQINAHHLPVLNLNNIEEIAEWIGKNVLHFS